MALLNTYVEREGRGYYVIGENSPSLSPSLPPDFLLSSFALFLRLVASLDTTYERMLLRAKLKAVGLSNTVLKVTAQCVWGGGGGERKRRGGKERDE